MTVEILRAATPEDHRQANQLLCRYFSHLADPAAAKWEWEMSPGGSYRLIARYQNHNIGHYGLIQYSLALNSRPLSGGKLEGSLVDLATVKRLYDETSDRTLRKVFQLLVEHMIQYLKSKSDPLLVFGFPNARARKTQTQDTYSSFELPQVTFRKEPSLLAFANDRIRNSQRFKKGSTFWRFRVLDPLVAGLLSLAYTCILKFRQFGRKVIAFGGRRVDCTIEDVETDSFDSQEVSSFLSKLEGVTIHRSPAFLRWRVVENTAGRGQMALIRKGKELVGCIAIIPRRQFLYIEDLVLLENNVDCLPALLAWVKKRCRSLGCRGIDFRIQLSGRTSTLVGALRRSGFFEMDIPSQQIIIFFSNTGDERLFEPDYWYVTRLFNEGI